MVHQPHDVAVPVNVDEWRGRNQAAQEEAVGQFLWSDIFFSVKAGLLQHFVGFLIEGNDAVLVEQSFKLEQFRVLLVKIPGG